MKIPWLLILALVSCFSLTLEYGVNGGFGCAACTISVGLIEQLTVLNNNTLVDTTAKQFCQFFSGEYNLLCGLVLHIWGPAVIEKLTRNESADVICYSLGICHVDTGRQYCHLFPKSTNNIHQAVMTSRIKSTVVPAFPWHIMDNLPNICYLPGIQHMCDAFYKALHQQVPGIDIDQDLYSAVETLRGSAWRGKDCNDVNEFVYPGRTPQDKDKVIDSNCNGIFGVNPKTGKEYEDELCKNSGSRGIIYIGDSVGARFHLPVEWFTASKLSQEIFDNFSYIVSNQFDWPQISFPTGYKNLSWPVLSGKVDSIYLRLRERNLCNHRDFQNICFNGAATDTMMNKLVSISRDKYLDNPAIVFYSLMGNDVCQRFQSDMNDNTSPDSYRKNVVDSLTYLNEILPAGSHVILVGLVDGSFIYPTMSKRVHPIGSSRGDVTYENVYEWWNCMQIGPCFGWMNNNETIRNATTMRAKQFTGILEDIAAIVTFPSFKIYFIENPFSKVVKMWKTAGFPLWKLLEPIDSMHPVQETQTYITEAMWSTLAEKHPEILGDINANNDKIRQLFGEQGAH